VIKVFYLAMHKDVILLMENALEYIELELSSLGGFPLEETSERECNPSIKGSQYIVAPP
jgi:hypothetical protein